ncbi:MAG: hypothetical protein WAU00_14715 [Caldilinea sp.]|uniref:hypothetical protein n=1 Tax=Caldilinea sp. TaxID=2293560 RepID=UPI002BC398C6|nr:hypothetical protein [Caldilinea sp.]
MKSLARGHKVDAAVRQTGGLGRTQLATIARMAPQHALSRCGHARVGFDGMDGAASRQQEPR